MTIRWSYRVKVSGRARKKKTRTHKGGGSTLYKDANGHFRFQLWQEDSQPRPLFLGVLMAWAGSLEKDVYFSAVPSQKSTVSLASDNHRAAVVARWLGLSWPHPASPASRKNAASAAHDSHPVCKNRRKGATQKAKCDSMCLRPAKIASFYQRRWQLQRSEAAWFLLNLNVAGCTEPICHQNNRHAETYMTLATDGSLVSWSTGGSCCETHFFSVAFCTT